jgi:hypothetical protein
MLEITNIKWKHKDFTSLNLLQTALIAQLKSLNLIIKMTVDNTRKAIVVADSAASEGKTVISSVDNKIMLKEGDPRIVKKGGRTYLETKRPTKEQYEGFFNTIQTVLDSAGLSANVTLIVTKTKKTIVLRDGYVKNNNYPKMNSFPIKA